MRAAPRYRKPITGRVRKAWQDPEDLDYSLPGPDLGGIDAGCGATNEEVPANDR